MSTEELENLIGRLEFDISRLEVYLWSNKDTRRRSEIAASEWEQPQWLLEYNRFHNDNVIPFLEGLQELGSDMEDQGKILKTAFRAHKILLSLAGQHNRPIQRDFKVILKPLIDAIDAVQDFKYNNRDSKYYTFLTALSNGVAYLGWVVVTSNPVLYVRQMAESAQSSTNKILHEHEEWELPISNCAKSWVCLIESFTQYVKRHHATGLQWNIEQPTMDVSCLKSSISSAEHLDWSSIFAIIETKWIQHSNTQDRMKGLECIEDEPVTIYDQPILPILELHNNKWIVQNQFNNQGIIIDETNEEMDVYMYNCKNSRLQVRGRFHSLTLDCCNSCEIIFDELVSTCAFVGCESIEVKSKGSVPKISIDKS